MRLVRHTALAAAFLLGACGDESADLGSDDRGAGVGGLGGSARVDTLARTPLATRPSGEVSWIADEVRLDPSDAIQHSHELAFAYARGGSQTLRAGGVEQAIPEGGGVAVPAGSRHRHASGERGAVLWEIRLARPGSPSAAGMTHASRLFESEPLEGIPVQAEASLLSVSVPPRGGRTTVHTHPGPELIYQLSGLIEYQNTLIGTKRLGPGGLEGIPPGTAVQKRNPFSRRAVFLSWFLVDPHRPFAPKARFP